MTVLKVFLRGGKSYSLYEDVDFPREKSVALFKQNPEFSQEINGKE